MKKYFFLSLLSFCLSLFAWAGDEFSYEDVFKTLKLPPTFSIDPEGARDGGPALMQSKQPDDKHQFLVLHAFKPEYPKYQFGGWVRVDPELTGSRDAAGFFMQTSGIDGMQRSYYIGGAGDAGRVLPADGTWQYVEAVLEIPDEAVYVQFGVSFRGGLSRTKGKYWVDGAFVKPLPMDQASASVAVRHPLGGRLVGDSTVNVRVEGSFFGTYGEDMNDFFKVIELGEGDHVIRRVYHIDEAIEFELSPADYPTGVDIPIRFHLEEKESGKVRSEIASTSLRRVEIDPANSVTVDERGRTLVNGQPFMPIGLYMGVENRVDTLMTEHFELIADSDFNTVKPNTILKSSILRRERTAEEILAIFDELEAFGLKCVLHISNVKDFRDDAHRKKYLGMSYNAVEKWQGLEGSNAILRKVVETLKGHPALLAYYTGDELRYSWKDVLVEKRLLLREIDPSRPTWGVFMHMHLIPRMLDCYDIIGVDPYPIRPFYGSIGEVQKWAWEANRSGWPHWDVPQLHNFGQYNSAPRRYQDDPEAFKQRDQRAPNLDELKAMVLTMAVEGSKGFLFYAYNGLLFEAPTIGETFEQRWQDAKDVATLLKHLEPFIMSDHDREEISWVRGNPDVVGTRMLADDGREAVIVVNMVNQTREVVFRVSSSVQPEVVSGHRVVMSPFDGGYELTWSSDLVDSLVLQISDTES